MPDLTVTDVVFDVGAANTDTLRASWKTAKARYEPETRDRGIDFSKGLGPALDKWAVSYKAFNSTTRNLGAGTKLWTKVPIVAQTKLKADARALKTDATAVSKAAVKYLNAIEVLGDHDDAASDSSMAKHDLTTILTKIRDRANQHVTRAQNTINAH
jgi:hypothetical protein